VTGGGPAGIPALLLRAEILLALERTAEARTVFESVRVKDPANAAALGGIARLLLDQGAPAEARTLLQESLPKIPADPNLYLLLAEAEAGRGELADAARLLEEASAALPSSEPVWSRLAEVRIRQEYWPKAAEALAHSMALSPKRPELALRAGFVAEKLGHEHEALALYEHATEIAPSNKFAWSSRGLALLAIGRPEEALPTFDRALGLDSDFEAAKEGKKAALQKTREGQIERSGREALLLEARLGRPVTRNDLFVTLHVPYDLLEPLLTALSRTPTIDLGTLTGAEMQELEAASCQLVTSALEHRPEGIERAGLTLADVAVLAPTSYSLAEIQRVFGYVRSVLEMDLHAENLILSEDVEELARRALILPEEQRTLFQLVLTLRVGLYKARVIKAVESVGGAVHAPLPSVDLGRFTPEFRAPAAASAPTGPGPIEEPEPRSHHAPTGDPGAGFFPVDDESPLAPPMAEPPIPAYSPSARVPAGRASAPRCLGCGGLPSFVHSCGATLCQHCIAQYGRCPKCSLAVDSSNSVAIHGGPAGRPPPGRVASAAPIPSVRHPHAGGAPAAPAPPAPKGPLRGLLGRAKATLPARVGGGGAGSAKAEVTATPTPPAGRTGGSRAEVPGAVHPEPPAPPPPPSPEAPPRPRPKRDDEPRL
ncbi:MAG: tetratricopeptide repeat protein, partial [Thermoplasmata archaeon]